MVQNITLTYRKNADLTLREFAEQVGVSFQAVSAWEHGLYPPGLDRLLRIWSDNDDWRRQWAAEVLAAEFPTVWEVICRVT